MIASRLSKAKALAKDAFVDQGRKLGERRRSDTSVFPAINDADQGPGAILPGSPRDLARNPSIQVTGGVWLQGRNLKELTEGHHNWRGACGSIGFNAVKLTRPRLAGD